MMSQGTLDPPLDAEGREANRYDLSIYKGLPKVGPASQQLQKAAMAFGLRTLRTARNDFSAWDHTGCRISFAVSFSEETSPVTGVITGNKQLTRQFLQAAQAAVPQGRTFRMHETDAAISFAEDLGYPVVVKPLAGRSGAGVVAGITDELGVQWAVEQIMELQGTAGRFIVEDHIEGQDYRIYVAFGEVLSVVLRRPASVIGDGVQTISRLVESKNAIRMHNPHTRTRLIRSGATTDYQLAKQRLGWESVPEAGQEVRLAAAANISRGGDSVELLPETHPSIIAAAIRAAKAIPALNQAGVDFLLVDHRKPLDEQAGGICEINTAPALMANQAPVYGQAQPVAQRLVRAAAKANGLTITRPRPTARILVRAGGSRDPNELAEWLVGHARRLKLGGRIRGVGDRHVRAIISGPVDQVSALVASMHSGSLSYRPDWVRTIPTARSTPPIFLKEVQP